MSEQRYTAVVTARTARPRSKRLRQAGASAPAAGSNVSVTVYGQGEAPTASADGHTHDNKALLDRLGADSEGYLLLTRLAPVEHTDEETGEVTVAWETVTERIRAGYADHAATADVALSLADDSQLTGKILKEANAYTDQALEQANAYTAQALEQAKAYSDRYSCWLTPIPTSRSVRCVRRLTAWTNDTCAAMCPMPPKGSLPSTGASACTSWPVCFAWRSRSWLPLRRRWCR